MKIIENIEVKPEVETYIDALHTALVRAGLFEGPKYMLYGMTGMAFKFVSHKKIISPSRYMYHMDLDSWKAVDRIGIYNEIHFGNKENPTFPLYQKKAIQSIIASINRGVPALFWDPGHSMFGVIYGFDNEDEVFFYKDRFREDEQILLYSNLGKIDTAFWLCQVFGDKVDKDIRDIYIDSLESAVYEWERYNNVPEWTKDEYASGKLAYDYVINALEQNDYNERGTYNTIMSAVKSKESIYLYFKEVMIEFPLLNQALKAYKELNGIFIEIEGCLTNMYEHNRVIEKSCIPQLVNYLREAKMVEEAGISEIRVILKEILYNRYVDFYGVKKYI